MSSKTHNPEKRAWKGRSYKKGGERIRVLPRIVMAVIKEAMKEAKAQASGDEA